LENTSPPSREGIISKCHLGEKYEKGEDKKEKYMKKTGGKKKDKSGKFNLEVK
jgi:hypothetical protein